MRNLWPDKNEKLKPIDPLNQQFNFTRKDWDALQNQIQALDDEIKANKLTFEEAMQQLSYSLTTRLVTAENVSADAATIQSALIHNLSGDSANVTEITADRITAAVQAVIESVIAESASINSATINEAQITTLTGDTASFDTVSAQTFDIDNYEVTNGTINNATIGTADVTTETVGTSTIGTANITDANITNAVANDLISGTGQITQASLENITNEFTNHNALFNKQVVDETTTDEDYWIVLPKLRNGVCFLVAKSRVDNAVNWTMEITNSTQNNLFRWGVNLKDNYLQDVEIIQDSTDSSEFIQIHAKLFGEGVDLYHRIADFQTNQVPQIYDHKVYDGVKNFKIERSNGMYMPNATFAGEFHADSIVIDKTEFDEVVIDKAITLPSQVDQYGQVISRSRGTDWQYIVNFTDDHGNNYPKWISASTKVAEDDSLLTSSDTVAKYDGKVDNPDYDPTDPDSPEFKYPIVNLGDNTDIHGSITIEGNTRSKHIYDGAYADYPNDMPNQSLVVFDGEETPAHFDVAGHLNDISSDFEEVATREYRYIGSDVIYGQEDLSKQITGYTYYRDAELNWFVTWLYDGGIYNTGSNNPAYYTYQEATSIGNKLTRKTRKNNADKFDELAALESTADWAHSNNLPVIYDAVNNTLKPSADLDINIENVEQLTVNHDLHVKGDAYIDGTLHTVEEETIESVGDKIVLRANNPSSLGSETSGIVVNNYDGLGSSLELGTDASGTLRVGTGTPTVTTYLNIYYEEATGKWYSDAELTIEVEPVGYLKSWETVEKANGVVHYTHAVFAYLRAALEPILTRDEEVNLNDQGLLIWDADDVEAKTLSLPTNDNDVLVPTYNAGSSTTTTVFTDGTNFYGSDMIATTEPSGTAGTPVSVGQFVYYESVWFAYKNSTWYDSVDSFTDDTNWTEVSDLELIAILDAQTKLDIEQVTYTEVITPGKWTYSWQPLPAQNLEFATMADYTTYAASHTIPLGSRILILNEETNVFGEDINE